MLTLAPGARLADGRFQLVRSLGQGGLGEVWLAQDGDRRVALKVLAPEFIRHPGALELLRREFARQRELRHPHILEVYELVETEGTVLLVMQHAPGGDIAHLRGAPWARLLPVLLQISMALEHAHAAGLVHRDLKCANVLLDADGAARVADFGHAAPVGATGSEVPLGGGTLASMSPQQLEGAPPAPADDLYAFGVLCHELLSGEPPLGEAPDAAAVRVRTPAPLSSRVQGLPQDLASLIDALLAKSPSARPASMGVVRERLQGLQRERQQSPTGLSAGRPEAGASAAEEDDAPLVIAPVSPRRRRATTDGGAPRKDGSRGAAPGSAARAMRIPGDPRLWTGLAFALLLALLAATVFWLPRAGSLRPLPVDHPTMVEVERTPAPAVDPLPGEREEDAAALRRRAEEVLGRVVMLQTRLEPLQPVRWATQDWARAGALAREGDDLLLARRFEEARERYTAALELLEGLEDSLPERHAAAMEGGAQALEAGDAAAATAAFELALLLRPDDAAATAELARAGALAQVLARMAQGRSAEAAGDLTAAAEAYQAALALDGRWTPAREALARVRGAQADAGFAAILSRGFGFMGDERYREAIEAFEEALRARPQSRDAREGLAQAELGFRLQRIRLAQVRATAFERQERWDEALAQYREALEIDDTLGFAREGRSRAELRSSLDAKLSALLDAPGRLFDDRVLAEARGLLAEAGEVLVSDGGRRLEGQVERLQTLVELAATPVEVALESDGLTEVRVFRVGPIGRFERTTLQLRPGDYTIVGSRDGFRDVRVTLSVRPGQVPAPVRVVCTEPI